MKKFIRNIGLSKNLDSEVVIKLRLVRIALTISLMAMFFSIYVNTAAGQKMPIYVYIFPISVIVIGFILNVFGKYVESSLSVILGFCVYFPFQHYLYGMESGLSPLFLVMMVFVIVILEGHRLPMIIAIVSIFISYLASRFAVEMYDNQLAHLVSDYMKDVYFISACFVCLLLLISVLRLKANYLKMTEDLLRDVNSKNETLKLQNEELENFAFATSHDLKTPLRNINSFVGLIEMELNKEGNSKLKEYINIVKTGSIQMSDTIDNILSLSSINKEHEFEFFSLQGLMDSLTNHYTEAINNGKIRINYSNLPVIYGIKREISIMMMNLIDNGIKYNQQEVANINIETTQKPNQSCISVRDNGIGISEEYHETIYRPFKRLHSDRKYKGTGLGLAIVKKVVDTHKGVIDIQSGKSGTCFTITLPTQFN